VESSAIVFVVLANSFWTAATCGSLLRAAPPPAGWTPSARLSRCCGILKPATWCDGSETLAGCGCAPALLEAVMISEPKPAAPYCGCLRSAWVGGRTIAGASSADVAQIVACSHLRGRKRARQVHLQM
jgi:hypothetical protein